MYKNGFAQAIRCCCPKIPGFAQFFLLPFGKFVEIRKPGKPGK